MGDDGEAQPTVKKYPRRHTAGQWVVLVVNCIVVLACVAGSVALVIAKNAAQQSKRVALAAPPRTTHPAQTTTDATSQEPVGSAQTAVPTSTIGATAGQPDGENFLVVGIDNNACIDPNSPYAPFIGARTELLTDTIMMVRVDRSTNHAALLSFPRDLYVHVGGHMQRINTAYRRNDPTRLADTIYNEFGIATDHFIGVDFCAFTRLVDALGGIAVPLPYAMRDLEHTGLDVEEPGCHTFAGDEALAYVRSRHLQYRNSKGEWKTDPSSDRGRIARQQDFVRRVLTAAKQHLLSPSVISGLYDSYKEDLLIDNRLSISDMIELSNVLRDVDTTSLRSYQVEATGKTISGAAVLIPNKSDTNTAILDIFRGIAPVVVEGATSSTDAPPTATEVTSVAGGAAAADTTTTVSSQPESNAPQTAIYPDPTAEC